MLHCLHIIACFIMSLLNEFMNEDRVISGKRRPKSSLAGNTDQEVANFTAFQGPSIVFDSSLM